MKKSLSILLLPLIVGCSIDFSKVDELVTETRAFRNQLRVVTREFSELNDRLENLEELGELNENIVELNEELNNLDDTSGKIKEGIPHLERIANALAELSEFSREVRPPR